MQPVTSGETRAVPGGPVRFRAFTRALVPESGQLRDDEWLAAEAIVARAIARRPARVRRQLELFVRLLDIVALLRHGRSAAQLSTEQRFELLDALSRSRLLMLRRGVWGLRTLAMMGFYARIEAAASIGYRASAAGWDARHAGSVPLAP